MCSSRALKKSNKSTCFCLLLFAAGDWDTADVEDLVCCRRLKEITV